MASFTATLDACVLVPAALRDTLLRTGAAGLYRPRWSDMILDEVERVLVREGMTTDVQARVLRDTMQAHFPEASVSGHDGLIPAMTNDPKDRHVLAAAVVAGAQVIVTSNLRDFPTESLIPHRIEAQSPDEFLTDLFDLDPPLVLELVRQQAAALRRPPQLFAHVLEQLARHAPMFVEHLRVADR
jgi:predicted nucleic acid-binding protein